MMASAVVVVATVGVGRGVVNDVIDTGKNKASKHAKTAKRDSNVLEIMLRVTIV